MKKLIAWIVTGLLVLGLAGVTAYSFINYGLVNKGPSVDRIAAPEKIVLDEETMKLTWSKVDGAIGYIVAVNDDTFVSTKNSTDLTSKIVIPEVIEEDLVFKIGVSAISGDIDKVNSEFIYLEEDYVIKAPEAPVCECEICDCEECLCAEVPVIPDPTCPECDHSDCSYVEGVEGVECDFVCDHSDCAKQDYIEAVAGVECDYAETYASEIAEYFTLGSYGWVNARVDAFDADLNRLWFYLTFEDGVSIEAIKVTLTDEAGNEVIAVAKYNALAAANSGYAEIAFRDKAGSVYPFAHNGYWDTILTELEEGVNEVASIKIELTTDSEVIVVNFDGECNLIISECDHSDCAYVEAVEGQEAVECDSVCDHSDCSYVEEVESVECDYVCDHSECGYVELEELEEDVDPSDEE